jgi:hypothetical protein
VAKQDKKGKGSKSAAEEVVISVSAHPRARRAVRRTKAWAGLAGFALAGLLSYQAGADPFEAGVRALLVGIGCYLAAWFGSVAIWQKLVVHEAEAEAKRIREEREELVRRMTAANQPDQPGDGNGDGRAVA